MYSSHYMLNKFTVSLQLCTVWCNAMQTLCMPDNMEILRPAHLRLLTFTYCRTFKSVCQSSAKVETGFLANPTVTVCANGNHRVLMETTEPQVQWTPTECKTCHHYISRHRLSAVITLVRGCYNRTEYYKQH